jgi:antitoxin ParD1/3/4
MRTNIDIDDKIMAAAMKSGEFRTKREAVEAGLRLLARQQVYQKILALKGKLELDDSLGVVAARQSKPVKTNATVKNSVRGKTKR